MTTKEKVIREAIKRVEARRKIISSILDANPLSDIIKGRMKAQEILKLHKGDHKKIAQLIKPLAVREKELFALAKKQNKASLVDEEVQLSMELGDLNRELYYTNVGNK